VIDRKVIILELFQCILIIVTLVCSRTDVRKKKCSIFISEKFQIKNHSCRDVSDKHTIIFECVLLKIFTCYTSSLAFSNWKFISVLFTK